jgi:hypothetical protein
MKPPTTQRVLGTMGVIPLIIATASLAFTGTLIPSNQILSSIYVGNVLLVGVAFLMALWVDD